MKGDNSKSSSNSNLNDSPHTSNIIKTQIFWEVPNLNAKNVAELTGAMPNIENANVSKKLDTSSALNNTININDAINIEHKVLNLNAKEVAELTGAMLKKIEEVNASKEVDTSSALNNTININDAINIGHKVPNLNAKDVAKFSEAMLKKIEEVNASKEVDTSSGKQVQTQQKINKKDKELAKEHKELKTKLYQEAFEDEYNRTEKVKKATEKAHIDKGNSTKFSSPQSHHQGQPEAILAKQNLRKTNQGLMSKKKIADKIEPLEKNGYTKRIEGEKKNNAQEKRWKI